MDEREQGTDQHPADLSHSVEVDQGNKIRVNMIL